MENGEPITVKIMLDVIHYILSYILRQSSVDRRYTRAKTVLFAAEHLLSNKQYEEPSKEAFKALADVLRDMNNETARSDRERVQNELVAALAKRFVDEWFSLIHPTAL
ncbi:MULTISPECIES: hypothetical protein [unclassified Adlercreutzia]|uniref:hypothetical protein n=1 Tax=unclassified Adlercreutzia TaxID=2636013 RepID=UPI0013E9DFC6|nr:MULTISPECIES: hypothetical protein [unclassified Adlercreutzia]